MEIGEQASRNRYAVLFLLVLMFVASIDGVELFVQLALATVSVVALCNAATAQINDWVELGTMELLPRKVWNITGILLGGLLLLIVHVVIHNIPVLVVLFSVVEVIICVAMLGKFFLSVVPHYLSERKKIYRLSGIVVTAPTDPYAMSDVIMERMVLLGSIGIVVFVLGVPTVLYTGISALMCWYIYLQSQSLDYSSEDWMIAYQFRDIGGILWKLLLLDLLLCITLPGDLGLFLKVVSTIVTGIQEVACAVYLFKTWQFNRSVKKRDKELDITIITLEIHFTHRGDSIPTTHDNDDPS